MGEGIWLLIPGTNLSHKGTFPAVGAVPVPSVTCPGGQGSEMGSFRCETALSFPPVGGVLPVSDCGIGFPVGRTSVAQRGTFVPCLRVCPVLLGLSMW